MSPQSPYFRGAGPSCSSGLAGRCLRISAPPSQLTFPFRTAPSPSPPASFPALLRCRVHPVLSIVPTISGGDIECTKLSLCPLERTSLAPAIPPCHPSTAGLSLDHRRQHPAFVRPSSTRTGAHNVVFHIRLPIRGCSGLLPKVLAT